MTTKMSTSTTDTTVQTTLQELESRLWDSANALRGPIDPADFKNYVFPMLFWKWISDTWEYEHRLAVAEFGDELNSDIEADYHRFVMPAGTLWRDVTPKVNNVGHLIQMNFSSIEQANPKSLAGIFGDVSWANTERLPEPALHGLIRALNQLTLDPAHVSHDLLGQGYEYLLKNFADDSGKKAGEFFTPRAVVNLIVDILDPQEGESVCDPAAGSGGMLVATINRMKDKGLDARTLNLYAQEVNLTTAGIARMNLFLHEIESAQVHRGDTLRDPGFRTKSGALRKFDVVIANPPFSLKNWGADTWTSDPRALCGVPPDSNGDFAWIEHMVASAKPGTGRVGVIMPHGVLFRSGKEAAIRECLIRKDLLEAVIGLPPNLFYSTTIPACILVFRTTKPTERTDHVLFVDGSARFAKDKNQNVMSSEDVDTLVQACRTGTDPDGDGGANVRLVPLAELEENGFDLNIGRYIKVAAAEQLDVADAIAAYQAAREARIDAEAALFARLSASGIANLGGSDG
jgi:type I restriction enzyme M protein